MPQNKKTAAPADMLGALIGAFGSGGATTEPGHATMAATAAANNTPFNNDFTTAYQRLKDKEPQSANGQRPRAYLNYVLFDEQFQLVEDNSGVKQVQATPDELQTLAQGKMVMEKSGFLYVYTSNESGQDVYFDNLALITSPGPLLEETHYYPFGLTMNAISAKALYRPENKYQYNGKELQNKEFAGNGGSGLEWYDYGARMYDVQIARWDAVDPHSTSYNSFSPYLYVANNPMLLIDPDGKDWFYHSKDGSSDPEWTWHEGSIYNTGVKDEDGNNVILSGVKAVVVFHGTRSEKLGEKNGKSGYIDGNGAITASVTVYGPDGENDVHTFRGFTMGSNAEKFGAIDEGLYDANYDAAGKSGSLKSHWTLNNRGNVRMMDGAINPYSPKQIDANGEGYKNGIFIHTSNQSGYAGEINNGKSGISVGCLLIVPSDWKSFNNVMSGVQNFKVQVTRDIYKRTSIQGVNGVIDQLNIIHKVTKKD